MPAGLEHFEEVYAQQSRGGIRRQRPWMAVPDAGSARPGLAQKGALRQKIGEIQAISGWGGTVRRCSQGFTDETGEPENISRVGFLSDDSIPDAVRKYIKFDLKTESGVFAFWGVGATPPSRTKNEKHPPRRRGRRRYSGNVCRQEAW